MMVAGTEIQHTALAVHDRLQGDGIVQDKVITPCTVKLMFQRISLRIHHHQSHGCIPCTLSFRATTTGVLAIVRSTAGVGNEKSRYNCIGSQPPEGGPMHV